ncbi:MAG: hypothetical protein J4G12_10255, partial [Gemmatimonadetes bacterium]|nr:hypothetical protein [Gemmatimonadota bacterium]
RSEARQRRESPHRARMHRLAETYNRWLVRVRVLDTEIDRATSDLDALKAERTRAKGQLQAARTRMDRAGRRR